jgi:glycosyltransferase involved in cell wall biosynthesis
LRCSSLFDTSFSEAPSLPVNALEIGVATQDVGADRHQTEQLELSVVMPCLNEADTLGVCVEKALRTMREHGIAGEVIVADNGSTDGSQKIARQLGARVVPVAARGYGNALKGGISAAHGQFVLMGDADDSYDFQEIPKFITKLREGYDLVQGCRLPSGGGTVLPGAMPPLHRWLGNPMFSHLVRRMFWAPIHDVYCGMRGFAKNWYDHLDLRCSGMEFATEMIIKASAFRARIAEVPITLHPDGRKSHPPHLKTFRDGWGTLRFFLLYCPRWLFFYPGLALIAMGFIGFAIALPGSTILGLTFDAHTLLFSSLAVLCGFQAVAFAISAKAVASTDGQLPDDPRLERILKALTLERVLIAGTASCAIGVALLSGAVAQWWQSGFGRLDYAYTMRWVIPGMTLVAIGFQAILARSFLSIVQMFRK